MFWLWREQKMNRLDLKREAPVYWESCVDSTSTKLLELANGGAVSGTVLTADSQTGGRGRKGRSFLSPEGGLYMSMLIRPDCAPENCTQITPLAAVAVHRALKACAGINADIKWPNDLLLNGKKLCGILTEMSFDLMRKPQVILGIGINLNTPEDEFSEDIKDIACSIYSSSGKSIKKEALLELLVKELDSCIERWEKEGCFFLEEYRQLSVCRQHPVTVISGSMSRDATAIDIEDDLSLRVRYEDGREERLFYGEVSLRI